MSNTDKNSTTTYIIKLIIGLAIMFCFRFIPAPAPITPLGMNLIGIFFGAVYLFSFAGMLWPSMLALLALGYSGATGSLSDTVMAAMGNSVAWQLVVLLPICEGISRSGATEKVIGKMMTMKFLKGHPMRVMMMLFIATFISGILISATATIMLMFTIVNNIRDMMGYEKGDKWSAASTVGVFVCALAGMSVIPYRGLVAAMIAPFQSIMGYPLDGATYFALAIIIGLVMCIVYPLIMRFIFKCDFTKVAEFDFTAQFGDNKLDRRQFILLCGILIILVFFVVQILVPAKTDIGKFLNGFGANGIFTLVAILLAVIRVDGKPCLDLVVAMKEGVPWGIIIGVAAMVTVAGQFSTSDAGITAWLNMVMGTLLNGLPPILVILISLSITVVLTGFFSNVGTCLIMMAAIIPLCVPLGINPTAMAVGVVIASNIAILSPGGSGLCPLLFFNDNESWGKIYKNGVPLLIVFVLVASILVYGVSLIAG